MKKVYFIRQIGTGFLKIGIASNPGQRFANIQVGSPQILKMIGAVNQYGSFQETYLHDTFSAQHFRGEWFREEGKLLDFIQNHLPFFLKESDLFTDGEPRSETAWERECARVFRKQVDQNEPQRFCKHCRNVKPTSFFYRKNKNFQPYCVECMRFISHVQRKRKALFKLMKNQSLEVAQP